jgi:hypothetical protein
MIFSSNIIAMKQFQIQQKKRKKNGFKKALKDFPCKRALIKLYNQNLEPKSLKDFLAKTIA